MSQRQRAPQSYVIPSRPETLITITRLMRAEEPDIDLICRTLKQDVALFSSVLGTVNTPYFGFQQKITAVERAVSLLGLRRLHMLVRVAALRNSLAGVGRLERFWDTASEVAHICSLLAARYADISRDDAYTLGMMHDAGIPLMMQNFPDFKGFLANQNGVGIALLHDWQLERYGVSHFDLGAQLAEVWHLPEATCEAIRMQPHYLDQLGQPAGKGNEQMRLQLSLLLIAKAISGEYRQCWRLHDDSEKLIELMPVLEFSGLCDYDFLDLKEDIILQLDRDNR